MHGAGDGAGAGACSAPCTIYSGGGEGRHGLFVLMHRRGANTAHTRMRRPTHQAHTQVYTQTHSSARQTLWTASPIVALCLGFVLPVVDMGKAAADIPVESILKRESLRARRGGRRGQTLQTRPGWVSQAAIEVAHVTLYDMSRSPDKTICSMPNESS